MAAEIDFMSATQLFRLMRERKDRPILLIVERMTGDSGNMVREKLCKGAHLFALLTPALVKEQQCIIGLQYLVEKHLQHCKGSSTFFHPVFFQGPEERHWFLPVFFQGWKGLEWFSGRDGGWGSWDNCMELRQTGKPKEQMKEQGCPRQLDGNFLPHQQEFN